MSGETDQKPPAQRGNEAVELLRAILDELRGIRFALALGPAGGVAAVGELDGTEGDPTVRFEPRNWKGEQCKGRPFSRCPTDLLDMLGETHDYMAEHPKQGKEKYASNDRRTARLARGWAARMRSGWTPPAIEERPRGIANGGPRRGYGADEEPTPEDEARW